MCNDYGDSNYMFSNSSFDYCIVTVYVYKAEEKRQGKSKRRFIEQKAFQMLFEKLFLMQKSDFTNLPYLLLEKEEDYETSRK